MQSMNVLVKKGYTEGEKGAPTREEVRELGFSVEESSADGKYYAVSEITAELPETLEELVKLAPGENASEKKETVFNWAVSKYKGIYVMDTERRRMESILAREIPAECQVILTVLESFGIKTDDMSYKQKSDLTYLTSLLAVKK